MEKFKLQTVEKDGVSINELIDTESNLVVWSEDESITRLDKILVDYLNSDPNFQSRCILWAMMLLGKDAMESGVDTYKFSMDMTLGDERKRINLYSTIENSDEEYNNENVIDVADDFAESWVNAKEEIKASK